ncbi:MAG: 3-dehydroquinate dehydratase-1 [Halobacteriales archaeon]|jgi:3-dehydroquinate dehydratase-1
MDFESFVLAASTGELGDEPAARDHADAVEFRMDLADDPLEALDDYDGTLPVIATNRAPSEGGEADEEGRLDTLEAAAAIDAVEAIDVELASVADGNGESTIETARRHGASTVASVHDFDGTPPTSELRQVGRHAGDMADVAKVAVTAREVGDVLGLLSVTRELTADGYRVATMAMGEPGRHSRVIAPLYGSRIGYAPVREDGATAPGQFDLETFRDVFERIR